jgi:hypothetical protein
MYFPVMYRREIHFRICFQDPGRVLANRFMTSSTMAHARSGTNASPPAFVVPGAGEGFCSGPAIVAVGVADTVPGTLVDPATGTTVF